MEAEIVKDIKRQPGVAVLFTFIGIIVAVVVIYYVLEVFKYDVVSRLSYAKENELIRSHVPLERHQAVEDQLKTTKAEAENLKKQLADSQTSMLSAVCNRIAAIDNRLIVAQETAEYGIQLALAQADDKKVAELRRHSEQLNQQILQVRKDFFECGRAS